jgi:hypothetical protein
MYHPDEIEEMEYHAYARQDYLSEAFGDEARMLDAQARYEMENGPDLPCCEDCKFALRLYVNPDAAGTYECLTPIENNNSF